MITIDKNELLRIMRFYGVQSPKAILLHIEKEGREAEKSLQVADLKFKREFECFIRGLRAAVNEPERAKHLYGLTPDGLKAIAIAQRTQTKNMKR